MSKKDLEFGDFTEIYEDEIYCAYMETGSYYDTEWEDFQELEYEDYLAGGGHWKACPIEAANRLLKDLWK